MSASCASGSAPLASCSSTSGATMRDHAPTIATMTATRGKAHRSAARSPAAAGWRAAHRSDARSRPARSRRTSPRRRAARAQSAPPGQALSRIAAASAASAIIGPSCEADAITESDIGSDSSAKIHGAAAPASAIAAAPIATETSPFDDPREPQRRHDAHVGELADEDGRRGRQVERRRIKRGVGKRRRRGRGVGPGDRLRLREHLRRRLHLRIEMQAPNGCTVASMPALTTPPLAAVSSR